MAPGTRDKLEGFAPRWSPTLFKATLIGFIVLAFAVPLTLVGLPFSEFFNGMAAQPKGRTQMTYGRVHGKAELVERAPVAGTIPRGYVPTPYGDRPNTIEAAKEVGELLDNPVPLTMENLQRGQKLFGIYCQVCHGPQGEGNGPATGANRFPSPPSLHTEQALQYRDGTVFHIITRGVGKMPAYQEQLDPNERWQVVHYLRALQRAMNPRPEDLKP